MTEWIVDTRGGICHQCDSEYQHLAGHWARNQSCTYRDLDAPTDSERSRIRPSADTGRGWMAHQLRAGT